MKKTFILFMLITTTTLMLNAQSWQWARRIGGAFGPSADTPNETVRDMQTDAQGNLYICGRVCLGANFNGTPMTTYSPLGYTIFLAKLDCNGNLLWVRTAGGDYANNQANSLTLDGHGNIYLTGRINGIPSAPVFFMDSTITESVSDMFLAKFDTAGNFKWVKWAAPGSSVLGSAGNKIRIDHQGMIRVMAHSALSGPFFPGYNANISGFVARFDTAGNMNGYMPISPGLVLMNTYDYVIHPVTGDQYITGRFGTDSLIIGTQVLYKMSCPTCYDLFFAKFDSSGLFQWVVHLGDTVVTTVQGTGIDFFPNHDVVLSGDIVPNVTLGSHTFSNSLSTTPGRPIPFVARFNPQGTVIWAVNSENQYITSASGGVKVLSNNNVSFSGYFGGIAKFGSVVFNSTGIKDIFLCEVSPAGAIISAEKINGTGSNDIPQCMTSDTFGNIFIGGGFDGTMTVNGVSYVYAGGNTDAFVAKYGYPCTSGMEEEEEAAAAAQQGLHIYPNPATEGFYIMHPYGALEQAEVYNLLGEKVITQLAASGQDRITFDISSLPAGLYVVTALRKGYRISGKLVVLKEE
jgi:hypothetical protein